MNTIATNGNLKLEQDREAGRFVMTGGRYGDHAISEKTMNGRVQAHWTGYQVNNGIDQDHLQLIAVWGVWCEVSGGLTGYRAAWLKEKDEIWSGTREEAEELAWGLNRSKTYGLATFSYTPMIMPGWRY